MIKSTRHSKIVGEHGEHLICNWLSRSGFEVNIIDHTGIDIIAYNPQTGQRMGITVKTRTRTVGTEHEHINVLGEGDWEKLLEACKAFACEPWFGVYVETSTDADLFLTSLKHYKSSYYTETQVATWKMRNKYIEQYDTDRNVMHVHFDIDVRDWFEI